MVTKIYDHAQYKNNNNNNNNNNDNNKKSKMVGTLFPTGLHFIKPKSVRKLSQFCYYLLQF